MPCIIPGALYRMQENTDTGFVVVIGIHEKESNFDVANLIELLNDVCTDILKIYELVNCCSYQST